MLKAFAQAFNQAMSFFFTLFSAAEHGAKMLEHISTVGEEKAKHWLDEERAENAKKLIALEQELTRIAP